MEYLALKHQSYGILPRSPYSPHTFPHMCVCIDRTLYMQATAFRQLSLLIQKKRTISQYF